MKLNHDDVVSISKNKSPLSAATFKISEMAVNLANRLGRELPSSVLNEWAFDGVECQVLKTDGTGWKNGRVRFTLEFISDNIPDEPKLLNPSSDSEVVELDVIE